MKRTLARRQASFNSRSPRLIGKNARGAWTPVHQSQNRLFQQTFVYLMSNFPFFMLNKFGISDTVEKRRGNVSETTPGVVFTVLSFDLAFGFEIEQFVHKLYKLQNVYFWTGSGRTEWFVTFSPIVGFSTLYINWVFGFDFDDWVLISAFFTPFIWLDGVFWLLFFWILKAMVLMAAAFFLLYLIAHIK